MARHRLSLLGFILSVGLVAVGIVGAVGAADQGRSIFRKPVPQGVVEIRGISAAGGIVQLKDGSLMLAQGQSYRISGDGGSSWGQAQASDI
ncbi:MAG: hypothetical protein EXQ58_06120 [Acidobacteria bacterium]|nr:hypothetical protein [Acidobacteriota bacterium]